MRDISFGWTSPAIAAREKTKTRRNWKRPYAESFKKGELVGGLDRLRFVKGPREAKRFSIIRLLNRPYLQNTMRMKPEDYFAEGFHFLHANLDLVPPSGRRCSLYPFSPREFEAWRKTRQDLYVVELEVVSVDAEWVRRNMCHK